MPGVEISPETQEAIRAVAQEVQVDGGGMDTYTLAETTLDANRLTLFGYGEADIEVMQLVHEHGAERVIQAAARLLQ